ncbi:fumarylacetoacetate hydrolase family protein [Demequina sp.]|uniref:fumarylacetoacetate hydrolase family protein n=1 Tax=Demequina sp. TaxID=2050685 RepID=UPI0025E6B0A3|nr:fumarylacetoacetate hydrolase family protein [Demequina sp.]
MRLANLAGRLVLVTEDERAIDVAEASGGRYGPDPMSAFADWRGFAVWARETLADDRPGLRRKTIDRTMLGAPVPRPPQILAIGVNYREHADEAGYPPDSLPVTFTKFASSLTGDQARVALPEGNVDWEVELVVAIGVGGHAIAREDAWSHVAGLAVSQDLSERVAQLDGRFPQFSLAKSHPGFSPVGPWLVTPDALEDPADLAISCAIDGETMQDSRTSRMIYDIPELIVRLSAVLTLMPGDIIFTGTPAGIGNRRTPPRFLRAGETLVSRVEGVGELTTHLV